MTHAYFDLFGEPVSVHRARKRTSGRQMQRDPDEVAKEAKRLSATGMTREAIARAIGVASSTLYRNYFSEIGGRHGRPGRRQHEPTEDTQRYVQACRLAGTTRADVARSLDISIPTLVKHYGKWNRS